MRDAIPTRTSEDMGKLILRVTLAVLILLHGVAKITGGVGNIAGMLEKNGLPPALAYLVFLGEVIAPLLMIIGAWTRLAAVIIAGNMLVAIAVAFLGAGRYSMGGVNGRLN